MNISTYESRIKALEDKLNPPAPSGNAGDIVAMSISPDFGGINAKLAAMMPLRWEDGEPVEGAPESVRQREITIKSDEAPEQPEQVSTTVTPSSGGYAFTAPAGGQPTFGEKDEPMSITLTKAMVDLISGNVGASDANSIEAASHLLTVTLQISY